MKNFIIVMLIMGGVINSFAQVPTRMFEKNKAFEAHPKFQISRNTPAPALPVPYSGIVSRGFMKIIPNF